MLKLTNITKTFNPGTITEKKVLRGIDLELDDVDFFIVDEKTIKLVCNSCGCVDYIELEE